MKRSRGFVFVMSCLVGAHAAVVLAPFVAPYESAEQDRTIPFAAPTRIHFVDRWGKLHLRPFVYASAEPAGRVGASEENRDAGFPVQLLPHGAPYVLAGVFRGDRHLFGVDPPARISLMGTDNYGRDVFSRLLYGGQISLFSGLLAAGLSVSVGTVFGALAGFYGRWIDAVVMRFAELFLALPWLYLLFAIRAVLPLHIGPAQAFVLIITVIGLVGWARPARLVRGVVLSARESGYVLAARGFGGSNFYLLWRHVLPQSESVILTQAALLIPQYILAEVSLSFLGLGVGEPVPSWGNMLASLQQYHVLVSYWWMFFPGLVLIPILMGYGRLATRLQERHS